MALNLVTVGYQYFPDPTRGRPIFNGSIYVGQPDSDPEIPANQKAVTLIQEDGTQVPVSQPVLTGGGGVPLYQGSPVQIAVDGNYSVKALDRFGAQVLYLANAFNGAPITSESLSNGLLLLTFLTVADLRSGTLPDGSSISLAVGQYVQTVEHTTGYGAFGGNRGYIRARTAAPDDNGSLIVLDGGTKEFVGIFPKGVNVKQFGAAGNGSNDDRDVCQNAMNYGAGGVVRFPKGSYSWGANNGPTIPSNTEIIGEEAIVLQNNYDASATISTGVEYTGFRVANGSENIKMSDMDIRGPFYGLSRTPAYRSIGINVSGRYDQYFYNNVNYPLSPPVTPTATSSVISIKNCRINGFGQSGVIADQIDNFECKDNLIEHCVRDGVRMYGCKYFDVSHNRIDDMSDGFPGEGVAPNNNVYGITATRIYHSTAGDGTTTDYRPTTNGLIANNIVTNCANWKGIDTHGGTDISFIDNIVYNAHIGIGIDKGGFNTADGYAPPRRLIVKGNSIQAGPSNTEKHRAGITIFAHDMTTENVGQDLVINSNIIEGFGDDIAANDGGVSISNWQYLNISGNIIKECYKRAIRLQQTVVECLITSNIIRDVIEADALCTGVNVSSGTVRATIDSNMFHQDASLTTMTAITTATPSAGYGAIVSADNSFEGNITPVDSAARLSSLSEYVKRVIAYGNINHSGGVAAVVAGVGITSVTSGGIGSGYVDIVFDEAVTVATSLDISFCSKGSDTIFFASNFSTNGIRINTRDSSNAIKDVGFTFSVKGY